MPWHWPTWPSSWRTCAWRLPSQCQVCRAWPSSDVLCADCWQQFARRALRCSACARALPGLPQAAPLCGSCQRRPPPWSQAYAWVSYAYPWNHLIGRWKYAQQPGWAHHWARWLRADPAVQHMLTQADAVIPIPLSDLRLRERGYNQSALLARQLHPGRYAPGMLLRTRHTPPQAEASRAQRLRNLQQAFAVAESVQPRLQGRRIVLVDDVWTTGATLTAAASCLRRAGVADVQVLCVARTP